MSDSPTQPAGWYYAQGDPPGTQRYWNGAQWQGDPQPVPGAPQNVGYGGGGGVGAGGRALAEPINRIGARVIDILLWIVVIVIINVIFGAGAIASGNSDISYGALVLAGLVSTALVAGYEVFMVGSRGATLGKMALGMKVTRMDGSAPDMKDAFMRILPWLALSVIGAVVPFIGIFTGLIQIIIGIVSLVFLFTDAQRQTVWDKVAKTLVVAAK